MILPIQAYEILAAGLTTILDGENLPAVVYLSPDSGSVTLAGDVNFSIAPAPANGTVIEFIWDTGFDLNGHSFIINGLTTLTQVELNHRGSLTFTYVDDAGTSIPAYSVSLRQTNVFPGSALTDNSVPLAKMVNGTSAQIPICGAGGILAYVSMTGDITITDAGVTAIGAGKITNAMISASAAIARSKLAAGTASHVVINAIDGTFSSEATLSPVRGGLGRNASADTGFVTFLSGAVTIGTSAFSRDLTVSFETGAVGDFKIRMAGAGTVVGIYTFVEITLGAAVASITPKNNAGTTMTDGTVSLGSADPKGTAYTNTPSANNTFVDGDILTFTTAGGSAAGQAHLSISYTKTA